MVGVDVGVGLGGGLGEPFEIDVLFAEHRMGGARLFVLGSGDGAEGLVGEQPQPDQAGVDVGGGGRAAGGGAHDVLVDPRIVGGVGVEDGDAELQRPRLAVLGWQKALRRLDAPTVGAIGAAVRIRGEEVHRLLQEPLVLQQGCRAALGQ